MKILKPIKNIVRSYTVWVLGFSCHLISFLSLNLPNKQHKLQILWIKFTHSDITIGSLTTQDPTIIKPTTTLNTFQHAKNYLQTHIFHYHVFFTS